MSCARRATPQQGADHGRGGEGDREGLEYEVSDRNEWFKDVKRLVRGLEVSTAEDPFAWPTVTNVDGEDVLHALGLHPSL